MGLLQLALAGAGRKGRQRYYYTLYIIEEGARREGVVGKDSVVVILIYLYNREKG